jgi:hypothetical protein
MGVMPQTILKEIQNIDSVEMVAICSFKGEIGFRLGELLPEADLKAIAIHLVRAFAALKVVDKPPIHMEIYWQNHFLHARFGDGFVIITICNTLEVMSLLRITLNVALANLLQNKTFLKWLKKHSADALKQLRRGSFDEHEISLISQFS